MTAASAWDFAVDLAFPRPDPYTIDPAGWVRDRLAEHFWSKQAEIAGSVVANRYTAVKSCHGVGKSFAAARLAAHWIDTHPVGEAFVVSTAPTDPQVKAILWRELRRAHRRGDLFGRITLDAQWKTGDGELVAYGRKPADTDPGAFQGIHARYVLVIIDEAGAVDAPALWDAIDSLVTNDDSRVLAIGNPDDPSSHFAEVCKPGSGWHVIRVSAFDSPNFTGEDIPEDLEPLLVSPTWVEERRKRWGEQSPRYISKVLGEFPEITEDTLILPAWVTRAQLADLEPSLPRTFGVDVARFGTDETVIYERRGPVVRLAHSAHKQATTETAGHVAVLMRQAASEGDNQTVANVDADGLGGGVVDQVREAGYEVHEIHGGHTPIDRERFVNARAEWYWMLRERFEQGDIDIDPLDDELASQLVSLKWGVDSRGRIWIESKDSMRRRGMPSPDRADGLAYSFAAHAEFVEAETHRGDTLTGDLLAVKF